MHFFFHARPMMQGRQIEFRVYRGTHKQPGTPCGALVFEADEWEKFRLFVIAAIRAAGYARVPIEFLDGTRLKPKPPSIVH